MKQFGRFEVVEEIGSGAMGAVYKARDPVMDRTVAIKTIHTAALAGPLAEQYRERFTREARAAGRLAHVGIVTMFDVGVEGDTPYLVMEFVPGRTLEDVLNSGERYTLDRVCEIGQQVAEALGYAHANGVVHRDIKPANILLTGTPERAKITDFGVAKLSAAQVTATGTLLGTPAFMAPEQFMGTPIDGRSDLFSLGVILYWMATGDKPFSGDTITAVSYKIVHTEPIPPRQINPGLPEALELVILRALAKDPAARYQTGEELAADLAALRAGQSPAATRTAVTGVAPLTGAPAGTMSTQATVPLGRTAETRRSSLDAQATVTPPQLGTSVPVQAPGATPSPPAARTAAGAATRRVTESRVVSPAAEPTRSKAWMYVVAAVVVLGLLWAAGAAKRKKEQEDAEQAARMSQAANPAPAPASGQAKPPAAPAETPPVAAPPSTESNTPLPAKKSPQPQPPEKIETSPATEDLSAYPLRLEVTASGATNVEVQADGNPAQTHALRAGQTLRAGADKVFQVRTDNAGAVQLTLNGQDMGDLGPVGAPRTLRLTAKNLQPTGRSATGAQQAAAAPARPRATGDAHVDLEVTNLPNFADFAVWVDDKPIFERPGVMTGGTETVSRMENIPAGTHTIAVWIGNRATKKGQRREISGDFSSGQTRALRVHSRFEGRRGPGMFMFDLALE